MLIIGILASIALPQYQKAVTKARFSEAFVNMKALADAVKICEMANGRVVRGENEFCMHLTNLDVQAGRVDSSPDDTATRTDDFTFWVDRDGLNSEDTIIIGQYKKEEICLCLYDDGHFSADIGGDCSSGIVPNYNVAKMLGVEEGCSCC